MAKTRGYALVAALLVVIAVPALAEEIQLAGMRLGQHAFNLLDIWGQPDDIATGEGSEQPTAAQAGGGAGGGAPMMGAPGGGPGMGMGMGMGGGMGPPGGSGGMMGNAPSMEGIGVRTGGGAGGGGAAPAGPPGSMGMGMGMMGGGGMGPTAMGGGGMMGMGGGGGGPMGMGGGGGMSGAGAAAAGAAPFPIWALPVWITLRGGEVEWIYQRGAVVMGFAVDRDGYITCIAVAGRDCNYARTALWQPHRYIKLGDSYKRLLYRYGMPDKMDTYTASGSMVGSNSVTVSFGATSRSFTRDCVLRYDDKANIAFTLHDFKVVRIHIWQR